MTEHGYHYDYFVSGVPDTEKWAHFVISNKLFTLIGHLSLKQD
jgi:hypothetical protein